MYLNVHNYLYLTNQSYISLFTGKWYSVISSSDIIYKELPEDDPKRRRPDISLAKSTLDWNPIVDLETGLKETINYFTQS